MRSVARDLGEKLGLVLEHSLFLLEQLLVNLKLKIVSIFDNMIENI